VEVNPAGVASSLSGLMDYCDRFARMAAQGYVEVVGDGHRSEATFRQWFAKYSQEHGVEPFGESQLADVVNGKDMGSATFGHSLDGDYVRFALPRWEILSLVTIAVHPE